MTITISHNSARFSLLIPGSSLGVGTTDFPLSPSNEHSHEDLETLKGLMQWFQYSSQQLAQEYRRLETRVAELHQELEQKNQALERSLREREEARGYLRSVLDSINAGVLVLDQDLCPTLVNPRLRELVGEVDTERAVLLLGERLADVLRRGKHDVLPLECERMVEGLDGVMTPVHLTLSEILLTETGRAGYALVFQDISRVKRLEVETARSRRLAALGEMAATIAHEVRSPLGGIELYASLLKENAEGETNRRANEILTAVHRMHTTISHLLSFVAEPQISGEALPASVLLKEVGELAAPLLRTGQWTLETHVEPGLPPLWGDRGLLVQALMNLVTNAMDAMPQGGRVHIAALPAPFSATQGYLHREIELRVTDEGVGIPPENRERIFDPFFSTKPKGTGLGLALTHKILCAHGGSISVAPAPERGSCFTLFLPAADGISRIAPTHQGKAQKGKVCQSVLS